MSRVFRLRVQYPPYVLAAALLSSAAATSCPQGWAPLGPPTTFSNISGADFDFDLTLPTVVRAVGSLDAATGATKIVVQRLNESYDEWATLVSHEPQFAQDYDHFVFRFRGGVPYVGIGIEGEGIASVLRGGSGFDGMDGSWAFRAAGASWSFDIDAPPDGTGDMRVFGWASATSLCVVTYNHTGWDTYPASNAFGPLVPVYAGPAASEVVALAPGPYPALAGAALLGLGTPTVTLFSVSNTASLTALPPPPAALGPATTVAVAWGAPGLCVAFDQHLNATIAAVAVFCMADPGASGTWVDAGGSSGAALELSTSAAVIALSLAFTQDGIATVVARAADGTATLARCALSPGLGCRSPGAVWPVTSLGARGTVAGAALRAAPASASPTLGGTILLLLAASGADAAGQQGLLAMCSA